MLVSLDPEDGLEVLLFAAVIQETVVTDFLETKRKYVHHKPAHELFVAESDLFCASIFIVLCRKSHIILVHADNAGICDRNAVSVSAKVFDSIAVSVEGFLDIRAPLLFVKAVSKFIPCIAVLQLPAGRGKTEFPFFMILLQACKEFAAELGCEYFGRDEKMRTALFQFSVFCQAAAGYDAVDMGMEIQFLPPRMKYLDDSGCCTEILWIFG